MFFFKTKYERDMDIIIARIEMNMSNNYKDAAQENLKELEQALAVAKESGKCKPERIALYEDKAEAYRSKLKGFTHKDQKPYWS